MFMCFFWTLYLDALWGLRNSAPRMGGGDGLSIGVPVLDAWRDLVIVGQS